MKKLVLGGILAALVLSGNPVSAGPTFRVYVQAWTNAFHTAVAWYQVTGQTCTGAEPGAGDGYVRCTSGGPGLPQEPKEGSYPCNGCWSAPVSILD
jgi:hypothetical protein